MITNLLEKTAKFILPGHADSKSEKEIVGTICAVFGENGSGFSVAIADETGKIHCVYASQVSLVLHGIWSVVLFWDYNHKIHAIKAIRGVTGMGLKDAKDLVEGHMPANTTNYTVPVKQNLTRAEADEIVRRIQQDNQMECEVRRMI